MEIIQEPLPNDSRATFDVYFDVYETMQNVFGLESAKKRIDKLVKLACHEDLALQEIFYVAYSEWKTNKDEISRKTKDAMPKDNP
jgi:hypothetical protein